MTSATGAAAGESATEAPASFAQRGHSADVAVIVVTYRSANDIDPLIASLRREAADHRLRVIVADNDSPDATLDMARAHADVIAMPTGGNLGYAGAINAAMNEVGDADAILVLNPDSLIDPGTIASLRSRLARPGVGVVVPRIVDSDGARSRSLRREPTVLRGLGEALMGARFSRRPSALAEMVYDSTEYEQAHLIDWATGAALLVSRDAAQVIGEWDERFFLYSEETDYLRRARAAGFEVWFEPAGIVRHAAGGSGGSVALRALLAVNRIRYFEKYHGRSATALFHATAILNEVMRSRDPDHREILRTIVSRRRWRTLPHSTRSPSRPGASAHVEGQDADA